MIDMAKRFPYFNEESETNWQQNSLTQKMADNLKNETNGKFMQMEKIDHYKVHDINFKQMEGESLPFVDCSEHSTVNDK